MNTKSVPFASRSATLSVTQASTPAVQRSMQPGKAVPPPVFRPQPFTPAVQRSMQPGKAVPPPVFRPQPFTPAVQRSMQPGKTNSPEQYHRSIIQRHVVINRARAYVGTETINTFEYHRDGCPGGNHFVSDLLVRTMIAEAIVGETRDAAADILEDFWKALSFRGTLTVSKADTEEYDRSINSLISAVSNQSSNLFNCTGSGDGGGTQIDWPDTQSATARVAGYAAKMADGLDQIKANLGGTGNKVLRELNKFLGR
jgi:hypothetical protein